MFTGRVHEIVARPFPPTAVTFVGGLGTVAVAVACVIVSGEELPLILRATSDILYVFVVLEVE